jgi:site-specific DNA-cytosine methylase
MRHQHAPEKCLEKMDPSVSPEVDLWTCGFPCQPFSSDLDHSGLKQ